MFRLFLLASWPLRGPWLPAQNAQELSPPVVKESPYFQAAVAMSELPPADQRIPLDPLVVDLAGKGRVPGVQGGTLHTMIGQGSRTCG